MNRIGSAWLHLAAGMWLAACAPCPAAQAGAAPVEPAAQEPPKVVWQQDLGGELRGTNTTNGVVLVDWDDEQLEDHVTWHELIALNTLTGQVRWRHKIARDYPGATFKSGVSGDVVCVRLHPMKAGGGVLRAFALRDGRPLWQRGDDPGPVPSALGWVEGVPEGFLIRSNEQGLCLYDRDGSPKWNLRGADFLGRYGRYLICHYAVPNRSGKYDRYVALVDPATGRVARKFRYALPAISQVGDVGSRWLLVGGRLVIAQRVEDLPTGVPLKPYEPALTCYALTGKLLWRQRGYGGRFVVATGAGLLVADHSGQISEGGFHAFDIVGLDTRTGAVRWRAPLPKSGPSSWSLVDMGFLRRVLSSTANAGEFAGQLYDLRSGTYLGPFPYHLWGRVGDLLVVTPRTEDWLPSSVLALKVPAWWPAD